MKDKTDMLVDTLVHAQCLVDSLEYFEENEFEERRLFRFNLKKDVQRVILQIRNTVDSIFASIKKPQGGQAIARLYDVNYTLHSELMKLDLNTKTDLTQNMDKVIEYLDTLKDERE